MCDIFGGRMEMMFMFLSLLYLRFLLKSWMDKRSGSPSSVSRFDQIFTRFIRVIQ